MATAGDLINQSLRLIGVLEAGKTAESQDSEDALDTLNQMIAGWSNEKLMTYVLDDVDKALTADDGTYSIGPTGDIEVLRPVRIASAYTRDSASQDRTIEIINNAQWSQITLKSQPSSYPKYLYYRPDMANGQINLWPLPSSGLTLYLEVWHQIVSFSSLTSAVSLPPGYERAIKFNLAEELGLEYSDADISLLDRIKAKAVESKAFIKNVNNKDIPVLTSPLAGRGRFNIKSGEYY